MDGEQSINLNLKEKLMDGAQQEGRAARVHRAHNLLAELEEAVGVLGAKLSPISTPRPESVQNEKSPNAPLGSSVGRELLTINARIEGAVAQLRRMTAHLEV